MHHSSTTSTKNWVTDWQLWYACAIHAWSNNSKKKKKKYISPPLPKILNKKNWWQLLLMVYEREKSFRSLLTLSFFRGRNASCSMVRIRLSAKLSILMLSASTKVFSPSLAIRFPAKRRPYRDFKPVSEKSVRLRVDKNRIGSAPPALIKITYKCFKQVFLHTIVK